MRFDSLALRLIAVAALWSVAALLVTGASLSSVFQDTIEDNFDERLTVLVENLVAVVEIDEAGELDAKRPLGESRFEIPFSGWYWQVVPSTSLVDQETPDLLRSRSLWDKELPVSDILARNLSDAVPETVFANGPGPEGQALRMLVRKIHLPGGRAPYLFAVAGNRDAIDREVERFTGTLAVALGILVVGIIMAIFIQVHFGLRPLRRVSGALASIRAGRSARLDGAFPAEIAPLADEVNKLLDHNEEIVGRARTQVGNLAHALKTPLSILTNEAHGYPGPLAETVENQSKIMRSQISRYLSRARTAATAKVLGARTEIAPVIDDLIRTIHKIYGDKELHIAVHCPAGLLFRGERQDLEEIIGNLLDNAGKWANREVCVTCHPLKDGTDAQRSMLSISVADDGPGLSLEERTQAMARGERLDETVPGSGLGLSIVRDIVELYGGSVELAEAPLGGLDVRFTLPSANAGRE